jgi:hypothetical protein
MKFPAVLVLMSLSLAAAAEEKMTKLKIPYSPSEVGECYRRLEQTLPVFQKGISDIRTRMESNQIFDERLRAVLKIHARVLRESTNQESQHSWNEEDIYLCCLYDMLESMYAAEANRIASGTGAAEERRKSLRQLSSTIPKLPFGSPQYSEGIRPRFERAVSNNLALIK